MEDRRMGVETDIPLVGFPGGASGKKPAAKAQGARDVSSTLGGKDPLEEDKGPTPAFLPGESHRQRSLVGYSPGGSQRVRHD